MASKKFRNFEFFLNSNPPGRAYSDNTAWQLAELSRLVYYPFETEGTAFIESSLERGLFTLEGTIAIRNGAKAMVVKRSADDILVLVFRGTQLNWSDILTDIFIVPMKAEPGWMHSGFVLSYQKSKKKIKGILDGVNPRLLYVTGHSLGAALALVATSDLEKDYPVAACYTFGCPRLGEEELDWNIKSPVYRVTNSSDIVTHLPPASGFFYQHLGDIRYLEVRGGINRNPSWFGRSMTLIWGLISIRALRDHGVLEYCKKLRLAARKQEEQSRSLVHETSKPSYSARSSRGVSVSLDFFGSKELAMPDSKIKAYSTITAWQMAELISFIPDIHKDREVAKNVTSDLEGLLGELRPKLEPRMLDCREIMWDEQFDIVVAFFKSRVTGAVIIIFLDPTPASAEEIQIDFSDRYVLQEHGPVHIGVKAACDLLYSSMREVLARIEAQEVYVAGHSLSGYIAMYMASRLVQQNKLLGCYIFGAPRLLTDERIKMTMRVFSIVNSSDAIARFPKPLRIGFGDKRYITADNQILRNPSWLRLFIQIIRDKFMSQSPKANDITFYRDRLELIVKN